MWLDQNVRISNELNKITRVGVMSLVDIAEETIFRFRFGEYRHAVEKALTKEHQHQSVRALCCHRSCIGTPLTTSK